MENGKDKRLIAICVVLVLFMLFGGGYLIYKGLINNNKDGDDNTEVKKKKETTTQTEIKEADMAKMVEKIDEYRVLAKYYPIDDINNIPNQIKLKFLYSKIENNNGDSFTVEQLKEAASKYLTSDFSFNNEDIKDNVGTIYLYNPSTNSYSTNPDVGGHDGDEDFAYRSKTQAVSGTYDADNNLYVVKVKSVYSYCSDVCIIADLYGSANKNDVVFRKMGEDVSTQNENAKVNLDCTKESKDYNTDVCKMDIYDAALKLADQYLKVTTYTFEKTDSGEFVLKSVK